ncbi:uncharacterized protein LOC116254927 [Nymphaea colorata]|nr:uncharacterized protein LOC116254927 [Nymphaea colorata]
MLQWMGGSRRKVTTSRKATRSRQRQYFEQKKRRQIIGDEKGLDGSQKHSTENKVCRSLDVLSLMSLSALTHQECKPGAATGLTLEVETALSNDPLSICTARETVDDGDVQSGCTRNTCDRPSGLESEPTMSPQGRVSLENSANNHPLSGKDLPSKKGDRVNFVKKFAERDLSVMDLVSDGGSCPERQPPNEGHVAFSIEGLGKLDAQTPIQTPKPLRRSTFPSKPCNMDETSSVRLKGHCQPHRIFVSNSLRTPKANVLTAPSKKCKGSGLDYNIDMSPLNCSGEPAPNGRNFPLNMPSLCVNSQWFPGKLVVDKGSAVATSEAKIVSDFWGEEGFGHAMEENTKKWISTSDEDTHVFDKRNCDASMSWINEAFHTVIDLKFFSIESEDRKWSCGPKYSCLPSRRDAEKGLQDPIEWPIELKTLGSETKQDSYFLYEERSDWGIDTGLPWCDPMQDRTDSSSLSREGLFSLGAANSHRKKSEADSMRTQSRKRKLVSQLDRDLKCDGNMRIFKEDQDPFVDFDDVHCSRTKIWPQNWCPQSLLNPNSGIHLKNIPANQRNMDSHWGSSLGTQSSLANEEFFSFPSIGMPLGNDTVAMDHICSHDLHFHVPDCSPSFSPLTKYETVNHFIPDTRWAVDGCEPSGSHYSVDPRDLFRTDTSSNSRSEIRKPNPNSMWRSNKKVFLNPYFLDIQRQVEGFDSQKKHAARRISIDESDLQTTDCNGTFEKVPGKQPTFADNASYSKDGEIADTIDSKDSCNGCDFMKANSKNGSNMCEDGKGETHDSVDNKITRSPNELVETPISQGEHHVKPEDKHHVKPEDKEDEELQDPDQTQ